MILHEFVLQSITNIREYYESTTCTNILRLYELTINNMKMKDCCVLLLKLSTLSCPWTPLLCVPVQCSWCCPVGRSDLPALWRWRRTCLRWWRGIRWTEGPSYTHCGAFVGPSTVSSACYTYPEVHRLCEGQR